MSLVLANTGDFLTSANLVERARTTKRPQVTLEAAMVVHGCDDNDKENGRSEEMSYGKKENYCSSGLAFER